GADGRFHLNGVAGAAVLVCAEAEGFRFGGTISGGGAEPVGIRLARVGEAPMATFKPPPSPPPRAEGRGMARELLAPLLPPARRASLGVFGPAVIPALARVDPARVLEMLENRVIADPFSSLIQVVLGQLEDDPATALATLQDDRNLTS